MVEVDGSDVFVLGAGFSRAIHESMPVMSGLADALTTEFLPRAGGLSLATLPPLNNVELFLSALAVDQPFMDGPANLRNRALYFELRRWLAEHIFDCQAHALGSELPQWLGTLVHAWHERRSTVVTLNYDTLIESAVSTLDVRDHENREVEPQHTFVLPIQLAAANVSGAASPFETRETFRLVRLHGSLSWFSTSAQSSPVDVGAWKDTFNTGTGATWEEHLQSAVSGEPMLVPPAFAKSEYYENAWVQANWREALDALTHASRVFVLGYSVPQGDTQVENLLGVAFAMGLEQQTFFVVDTKPIGPAERLEDVLRRETGDVVTYNALRWDPIPAFAESWSADPMSVQ